VKIGDILYFSPRYPFSGLDFEKPETIARAFQDRVEGFYFQAAAHLVDGCHAFAAGLVICAGVEFIAIAWGRQKPPEWLRENVEAFRGNPPLANKFWERFRHGLTHEGRVKSFGQFSCETEEIVSEQDDVMVVNPALLLGAVEDAFHDWCETMTPERSSVIAKNLSRYFGAEVRAVQG